MTDPRDNHSAISSLLNSLMSSPKLKKAAGVFVAAFVGAIAVNGFTGNGTESDRYRVHSRSS